MKNARAILVLIASAAAGSACAKSGAPATPPAPRVGVFHFAERPAQLLETIEGRIFVTTDSVVVDATPGPCRYDNQASHGSGPIVYQCADITLSFDRLNPSGRATYRTTTSVLERHSVCVRYTTDSAGHQVCAQTETQTTERKVPVTGTLHMERVAQPD